VIEIKYRIHWNLIKKQWTGHTYKSCINPDVILVTGEWTTELKPNRKTNPRGFVICDSDDVIHNPEADILNQYIKIRKLTYNKQNISFNYNAGNYLMCDSSGCWLMEKIPHEI
jgi:hypothetical protein